MESVCFVLFASNRRIGHSLEWASGKGLGGLFSTLVNIIWAAARGENGPAWTGVRLRMRRRDPRTNDGERELSFLIQ